MGHCGKFIQAPISRREMLLRSANGFGAVALAALLAERAEAARGAAPEGAVRGAGGGPHFPARAKAMIFLYMDGGPSQVDSFDPKPRLDKEHGQPFAMKIEPTQFNDNGNTLKSPWQFHRYGESGIPVSDLFPKIAERADDLCVIRSMVSNFSEHTNANYFLHTGLGLAGRPSIGSWLSYGLGSESRDLPGFVVLNGGLIPRGGVDCFSNGFLPAAYQGSILRAGSQPVANIAPREEWPGLQHRKLSLLARLDGEALERRGHDDAMESAIANQELAFRMQAAVPELMELKGETDATRRLYGFDSPSEGTRIFARQCLLARRLVERGVRFIELTCPNVGHDRWDQHGGLLKGHAANALAVDQPIAGLIADLESRGLLGQTLVLWAGEFGRTPFAQGSDGRDHNPFGFSIWLAGGGVKAGHIHGATDEYGYRAVEGKVEMYDLHATLLHLLGIDHKRLTFRFGGRDMRLTDVHGEVVKEVIG
jgi:uncharacterized protein DUF1501